MYITGVHTFFRQGHHLIYVIYGAYIRFWPALCIYTLFLAEKSPNLRLYAVCIYDLAHPTLA